MVNQALIDYLKTEEAKGFTDEQLKEVLVKKGWKAEDVEEALRIVKGGAEEEPEPKAIKTAPEADKPVPAKKAGSKKRNPIVMAVLSLITCGLFTIYWVIVTARDIPNAPKSHMLWLLLVPGLNIVIWVMYTLKYSKAVFALTGFNFIILFILFIVFSPVAVFLGQSQLNKKAG